MNNPYFRLMTPEDYDTVVNLKLRQADIEELKASCGLEPKEALEESLKVSELTWVIVGKGGSIVGVFGLSRLAPHVGMPWLLATEEIETFSRTFLRNSMDVIQFMLTCYPTLTNYVDSRHASAIVWLKWLRFSFIEQPIILNDPDVPFLQFTLHRKERLNV